MSNAQVIQIMNQYAKERIPFLVICDFEMEKPRIYRLDQLPQNILYNFNGKKNYVNGYAKANLPIEHEAIPLSEYARKFDKVKSALDYGNSFLLNLSVRSKLLSSYTLDQLFYHSKAKYKLKFKNEFLVFSPEIFVKIQNGKIYTFPMKGTIDADIEDAEKKILNNKKEAAEHFTIVDLLRNDLSIAAKNVKVDKLRYVEKIKTNNKNLLQVSSKISGVLPENYQEKLGDIFFKLLPAGSISGAPKKKTVELIQEIERKPRGYYTGVAGIFDGREFDSTVLIRYIENEEGQLYYRSGGGITAQSDLMYEYQEINDKIYVPVY